MNRSGFMAVCTAVFVVIGPLAGAAFFLMAIVLGSPGPWAPSDFFSAGMSLVYVFLLFGTYVLGAIPAAVAGALFGLLASTYAPKRRGSLALGAVSGLLASALAEIILRWVKSDLSSWDWTLPLAGAIGGAVCGLVCTFVPAPSNPSSKPMPLSDSA